MKQKLMVNLRKFRLNIFEYIITNRLFISYVIFSIIMTCMARYYSLGHFFAFRSFLADLGIILIIGALGYFVKPKKQFNYFFIWINIYGTIGMVNTIYYRFYASFASIGELATLGQTETVVDSIFQKLSVFDFAFILFPIFFYFIHQKLKKSSYYNFIDKIEKSKKMVLGTLIIGCISIGTVLIFSSKADYSRLSKQWNRVSVVNRFGILFYQGNDIIQSFTPRISSLFGYEEAAVNFHEYFDNKGEPQSNKYSDILKGYNIVFVHMESIQNFLMDLEFNGQEVTPNINKLAQDGMFFENFYPQISAGTSSDTEFSILSSLMPALSGTVFVSYYDRYYETIPKILTNNGYYTFSMHGNSTAMWNRWKVHPSLGYQEMFFKDSFTYTSDDVINLGINDSLFFKQGFEIISNIESQHPNYMGTIITLSNHSVFPDVSKYAQIDLSYKSNENDEEIINDFISSKMIGRYIKSSHFSDQAIGEFVNYVNESELFENTVFIFYGDHDAKFSRKEINYLLNYDPMTGELKNEKDLAYREYDYFDHELNKKTPLIIWTKNKELKNVLKGKISYPMSAIDISPTLLNMMGLYNKYSIGNDIFNTKNNNYVMFPNGNFLTNQMYYNSSTGEYKTIKENVVLDNNYIDSIFSEIEKKLQISNSIIVHDLIKKEIIDKELQ